MGKLAIFILCLFSMMSAFGQENKDFNFILVIDDAVWVSYTNIKVEIRDNTGSVSHSLSALYYPGNLSFEEKDYETLLASANDSITIVVDYKEHGEKKTRNYIFKLPFSPKWFDNYFMVMKVYNLEKRKYKGVFEPLDKNRNYTFELYYSDGQMLRVRNKVKKKRSN